MKASVVLQKTGHRPRPGNRADCRKCQPGHNPRHHSTVAYNDTAYFCHRCKAGGSIAQLARSLGYAVPPALPPTPEERERREFDAWLTRTKKTLGDEERIAWQRYYGLTDHPWPWLEWFFRQQETWNTFWMLASDNLGRQELFHEWKSANERR
jgi:hypothetical protein